MVLSMCTTVEMPFLGMRNESSLVTKCMTSATRVASFSMNQIQSRSVPQHKAGRNRQLAMTVSVAQKGPGPVALLAAIAMRNPELFMCAVAPVLCGAIAMHFGFKKFQMSNCSKSL
uniref:Uncharacterized protein n=1 Tax=Timspurckia oligopyrenoides TaxID=708627 RepID=A0A7S0ZEW0_9RHOD|mmetsp:Transcript_254/g.445  ORF Transcript_254/g.445 Transcript_254/m.445 type:complete len:116 (+) Transcript_254:214-561(+)